MENSTNMRFTKKTERKLESLCLTKLGKNNAYVLFCAEGFVFHNGSRLTINATQKGIREAVKKLRKITYEDAIEVERNTSAAQIELQTLNYRISKLERIFRDTSPTKTRTRFDLHATIVECRDIHHFLLKNCIIHEPKLDLFDLRWLIKKVSRLSSSRLGNGDVKYTVTLSKDAYCPGKKAQKEFVIIGNHELFSFLNMSVEYKEA